MIEKYLNSGHYSGFQRALVVFVAWWLMVLGLYFLTGCAAAKKVEGEIYDFSAERVSGYCQQVCGGLAPELISEERRQAREEIQERGYAGQSSPWGTSGPVLAIWCHCDEPVPDVVWGYIYDDERPE